MSTCPRVCVSCVLGGSGQKEVMNPLELWL